MAKQMITNTINQREEVLKIACQQLSDDLKTIEPTFFDVFLKLGQLPGVYDVVMAILERHFERNSMNFACTGDSHVSWDKSPIVALDLEFMHDGIFAFFRLFIKDAGSEIELHHISFDNSSGAPEQNTAKLSDAIRQVQLI